MCFVPYFRVGFSSLYFKTHASCKMMRGVIENLDRNKYFVVVFALRERHDPPNPNKNVRV
jgi:predicted O-linked N-acetylglucosamine transferase (SPINDLY family)